jgi:flagellar basal-body rod protein FlgG
MIKGIYVSANNLYAKEKSVQIIANNLANINTIGYKREVPFVEVFSEKMKDYPVKQITDFGEGNLIRTGNPLDLAISKNAFFVVKSDRGLELTKKGKFKISDEGFIENENSERLMGTKGEINVFETTLDKNSSLEITKNGEVKIGEIIVDKLLVAKIDPKQPMIRREGLNFVPQDGILNLLEEGEYEVLQGYLEESNVNPIYEMQEMIRVQKEFETSQKIINYLDQSLEKSNEIGRV